MNAEMIAYTGEILRTRVGSTVHGLNLPEQDDEDQMGITIEPPEYIIGLSDVKQGIARGPLQGFSQYVYRSQPEGVRSGPGDLDLTIYSLRKYLRLVLAGNPTVLLPLFAPLEHVLVATGLGADLREIGPKLLSRQCGDRFLGYLREQRKRVQGDLGQARLPRRPELVKAHGYDTKYAGHMLRLGMQGIELLTTGRLTLPMSEPNRSYVLAVRRGEVRWNEVMVRVAAVEQHLEYLCTWTGSPLPAEPNLNLANEFLIRAYQQAWSYEIP